MVPQREPTLAALGVFAAIGVLVQGTVLARHADHQFDLFRVEQVFDHQVAVTFELRDLLVAKGVRVVLRQGVSHGWPFIRGYSDNRLPNLRR